MMACECCGFKGVEDSYDKMIREKRMKEVLGYVIVALGDGANTANATGRKAEQWNNMCCHFGSE